MNRSLARYLVWLIFSTFLFLTDGNTRAIDISIERVSVSSSGTEGNAESLVYFDSMSRNGRFITFDSRATNLVASVTNSGRDIFLHDTQSGETSLVSFSSLGMPANFDSYAPAISGNGHFIAYVSLATNLVANDTNGDEDIFLYNTQNGETTLVSVSSSGVQGNNRSNAAPAISENGRFIVFRSDATNLVPDDTNGYQDLFLRDMELSITTRVNVSSLGVPGNRASGLNYISISGNGRYIAFDSLANNLVPNDTNGWDIFLHDTLTGLTTLVSVSSSGVQGNGENLAVNISENGRFVAWNSFATNLVPNDTNGVHDVFVRDMQTSDTVRVSVSTSGVQGNGSSFPSSISADGRFITFQSEATNLVSEDTNGARDVFVHDMQTGKTTLLSISQLSIQGNNGNNSPLAPSISADGRYVAFRSGATNLVPDDTNGVIDVFQVLNTLAPPLPSIPVRNYFTSLPITLTWNPISWAVGYQIQVATTSNFAAQSIELDTSVPDTDLSLTIPSIGNGDYYWRVCARNTPTTCGSWSTVDTFTVAIE